MNDHERIAKITSTFLGVEDHGVLTAMLMVDYGGMSQSIGGYTLDRYVEASRERVGTAYGMEWVRRCLIACGVDQWERVAGRTVFVIFNDDGRAIGIKPLPTELGRKFMFDEMGLGT